MNEQHRALAAVAVLLLAEAAQAEPYAPTDNWGGRSAHIKISAGMGAVSAMLDLRPAVGLGACMAVGVIKEVGDYYKPSPGTRHGLFSVRDLASDAAGCVLGYGTVKGVRWMLAPRAAYMRLEF